MYLDYIVVAHHDAGKRTHQARISTQKGKQASCILNDVPWRRDNAKDGDEQRASKYVDIPKATLSHVLP